MSSYLEKILLSTNSVTELADPEVDIGDVTVAKLTSKHEEPETNDSVAVQKTLLRRNAASLLESDPRYKGLVVSRKHLYSDLQDNGKNQESHGDDSSDDEREEEVGESDSEEESFSENLDTEQEAETVDSDEGSPGNQSLNSEEEESAEEGTGDSEEEFSGGESGSSSEEEGSANEQDEEEAGGSEKQSQEAAAALQEKAGAVVEQLDLWDVIMKQRIEMQKILNYCNTLPPHTNIQTTDVQQNAVSVLGELGCALCGVHLACDATLSPDSRKRKAETDPEELAKEFNTNFQSTRDEAITFWDERSKLSSRKLQSFSGFNTSLIKQIQQILSDRDKLLRRTQVNRSGEHEAVEVEASEIFDDNDFYERLLRQLVENKAEGMSSSASAHGHWLQMQKLKGKKKKSQVDTRASKGRKLRYNVHSKLVNFLTAVDDSTWSEEAKNELFKNLFQMPTSVDR